MRDIQKEIRKKWFKDHKAEIIDLGKVKILNWKKEGTNAYYVRYVFDECNMYISGDLGSAVFNLTWKAEIGTFDNIDVHYFDEKITAYSGERRDFSNTQAVERLRKWKEELEENQVEFDRDIMSNLISVAYGCSEVSEWASVVNDSDYSNFIREIDSDYWEWIYNIGDEIPNRVHAYLIGLKMASAQIKGVKL